MFNPLKGFGDMAKLHKIQKKLQEQEVVVEKNGVTVVMRGDQKIKEIIIDEEHADRVVEAINEAVRKTQEEAARTLMSMQNE
ncbi:YbaB/EbfC family nucleoid-associated protein [Candidatus Microgenomates bacterium]|nr:YbaB/EbfC family nucleoid-associated protein [Candidatus Microgenomates bacterium]